MGIWSRSRRLWKASKKKAGRARGTMRNSSLHRHLARHARGGLTRLSSGAKERIRKRLESDGELRDAAGGG